MPRRARSAPRSTLAPLDGASKDDIVPLTGNEPRALVRFGERRGTFVRHAGRVRFRFYLRRARFYAFLAGDLAVEGGADEEAKAQWL